MYTCTLGGGKALLLFQCVAYSTDAEWPMRCTENQCVAYSMDARFSFIQNFTNRCEIQKS